MNNVTGHTLKEILENGTRLAKDILEGKIPEGTSRSDWMIVGNLAVYTPYIPLFCTNDPVKPEDRAAVEKAVDMAADEFFRNVEGKAMGFTPISFPKRP